MAETNANGGYDIKCDKDRHEGASDYVITIGIVTPAMVATAKERATAEANQEAKQEVEDKEQAQEAHKADIARTPASVLAQQLKGYAAESMPGVNLIELAAAFTTLVNLDVAKVAK